MSAKTTERVNVRMTTKGMQDLSFLQDSLGCPSHSETIRQVVSRMADLRRAGVMQ